MAERRMFTSKVISSDQFMALPPTAQILYFQVCMKADDDGFLNNAGQIMKSVGAKPKDLRTLVERRFLLEFPGGVIVVKHWRMANSLKRDRAKPPLYPGVAAQIWIKPNKSYTDHPVDGCQTLLEYKTGYLEEQKRNPDGIQTESKTEETGIQTESGWNPKRIEENRTELNRTEEKGMEGGAESAWTSPEGLIALICSERQETTPEPMPSKLLEKAADLLRRGITCNQARTVAVRSTLGFLAGNNKTGWKATLGWLLDPDNFRKVLDGQYSGGQNEAMQERVLLGTAGLSEWELENIHRMVRRAQAEGGGGNG